MADISDSTTTPVPTTQVTSVSPIVNQDAEAFSNLTDYVKAYDKMLNDLMSDVRSGSKDMASFQKSVESNSAALGALGVAFLGVKKSFEGFGDTRSVNTFTSGVKNMVGGLKDTESGMGVLTKLITNTFGSVIPDKIKGSFEKVKEFAIQLAESADNGLKLQNGFLQAAAATGTLSQVFRIAGNNLENLNALLATQQQQISSAADSSNVSRDEVEKYYAQLIKIPDAMSQNIKTGHNADETTSMLTASIKVAVGTGRSYEEVIKDLNVAYEHYGVIGEDALKFTIRMSEVSDKFHIPLRDVENGLIGASDAFKNLTDSGNSSSKMTEGLTKIMTNYIGLLKDTGLSGQRSIDVINNMTGAVSKLTLAQKAFLSAQTGGPGGLMGGFQIEKMIRDGKTDQVFDLVRQQLTKQFGRIVTLDEATKSPAAAAQLARQQQILRNGPLGSFASTSEDANHLLEVFKKRESGQGYSPEDLKQDSVAQALDRGDAIQNKSRGFPQQVMNDISSMRAAVDIISYNSVQNRLSASGGMGDGLGTDSQNKNREFLKNRISNADRLGQQNQNNYNSMMAGRGISDQSSNLMLQNGQVFIDTAKHLPTAAAAGFGLGDDIAETPGQNLKGRVKASVGGVKKSAPGKSNNSSDYSEGSAGNILGEIMVNITGYCLKCQQEIDGTSQTKAVNVANAANK